MATYRPSLKSRYVVCVNNEGYPASLERRKIYQVLPDPQAAAHNLIRVIDESGEDYLYPAAYFVPITLSQTVAKKAFAVAA
ncbi:hypothetical protein MELA_02775 [Candidatus Methylomirabilis lanthanidiphila]|uniref:Uncharacterized protein n=1 Tax=Candidatus Methylomirabilis lanthanidiphila TaxID=2211376 RepID=A0A564ZNZ1_9BACT|nr:hypothetical protein [Candidatus Methylomirabilis lanthanidiphila]VUZ86372.1 hypothetical protein MELA_02775 [Candidatus Methylomirabilis lanthanidiphila]